MIKTRREDIPGYVTKDGSTIRELMHPAVQGNARQSLAEAEVEVGASTFLHLHEKTEEIYYILQGTGLMTVGAAGFEVTAGHAVCISPGEAHCIRNTGQVVLRFLCCSAPPYAHEDTRLVDKD